jgi:hypothetical protein|eukprot:COSAG06_NODE_3703_length_4995_cov_3.609273_2_plen_100_part_00
MRELEKIKAPARPTTTPGATSRAAFATLLICPCARQSSRKSAGSLVHWSGWSDFLARVVHRGPGSGGAAVLTSPTRSRTCRNPKNRGRHQNPAENGPRS